jgi:hypothetical protein
MLAEEVEKYFEKILHAGGWVGGMLMAALAALIFMKYLHRRKIAHKLAIPRIMPDFVKKRMDGGEDLLIVDVRNDMEMEADPLTLPGSYHVPLEQIEKNPHAFPADREIILYCN